jgi:hypothetical protein
MENLFNFERFWLLVRDHANDIRKSNFVLVLVLFIPAVFMHLINFEKTKLEGVLLFYVVSLVFLGGLYTSIFFKGWSNKAYAASLLMLPATALEKIALVLFYTVLVFIPAFTLAFYASHLGICKIFHLGNPIYFIGQYRGLSILPALIIYAFLPYLFFQSMVLLFTVWFTKRQTIRIFSFIVLLFVISGMWNMYYLLWRIEASGNGIIVLNQFVFYPTVVENFRTNTHITSLLITNISIGIIAISTLLFYIASYLKLKEKEI